jgi:hypothetical protein
MAAESSKVDTKPSKECVLSSENDPLDFSSIKNHTEDTLMGLILDHLVLLLQCTDEDNQIKKIHSAVLGITELYLRAQHSDQLYSEDPMVYDVETFLWQLWGLLFTIVQMIPYNHPKQELLVNFLETLRKKKVGTVTLWGVRVPSFTQDHTYPLYSSLR